MGKLKRIETGTLWRALSYSSIDNTIELVTLRTVHPDATAREMRFNYTLPEDDIVLVISQFDCKLGGTWVHVLTSSRGIGWIDVEWFKACSATMPAMLEMIARP